MTAIFTKVPPNKFESRHLDSYDYKDAPVPMCKMIVVPDGVDCGCRIGKPRLITAYPQDN